MSVERSELNVERFAPRGAVFLSYATQDAEAAKRICDSLRAAGVEVWFDQSELVGGDAWDQKIRKQIGSCALFVPIVSANTQARAEGYFRLEWKLADRRTDLIGKSKAFLLPVCIDYTRDGEADVPDSFLAVQWTKLVGGEPSPAFVARVKKLLEGPMEAGRPRPAEERGGGPPPPGKRPRWLAPVLGGAAVAALALAMTRPWEKPGTPTASGSPRPALSGSNEPALSESKGLSEARKLVLQARALIDDDWLAVRENFRNADDLCERATKLDPLDGEAWATWSRVSSEMIRRTYDTSTQRLEAARNRAERALQLAPDSVEGGLAMALALGQNQGRPEAIERLRQLLVRAPQDARVARALATILSPPGWRANAEATEIRLHHPAFAGRDPRPLMDEARTMYDSQRWAECEALMHRAESLEPCAELHQFRLAYLAAGIGDAEAARPWIAKVPARLAQEDVCAGLIATIWFQTGDGDKALAALRRVPKDYLEEVWFNDPKGLYTGRAFQVAGKLAAAESEWKQALVVVDRRLVAQPNEPFALRAKALLLALTGQREEAAKTWRLCQEMRTWNPGIIGLWGSSIHLANGENEEAIRLLQSTELPMKPGEVLLTAIKVKYFPWFEPIRGDPRVQQIIDEADAQIRKLRETPVVGAQGRLLEKQQSAIGGQPSASDPTPQTPSLAPSNPVTPDSKSVAVLAFTNLSDDKANEYFSDGISEELLNVLAKVPGLKVTARTSSFHFKGLNTAIPEIASQLGVAYVVEGSVRKQGDRVRITAQLIKAADGFHVWSDTFTRDLKDIFAVQDEIAALIAQNLKLSMGLVATGARRAVDPEAHRLVLEGRFFWNQRNDVAFVRAESAYQQALELDPEFAEAHAGLADVWAVRGWYRIMVGNTVQAAADFARAKEEVRRAQALNPALAEPYATLGVVLMNEFMFDESERQFARAIALNPNYAVARHWHACLLDAVGRLDESLREIEQSLALDPLSPNALWQKAVSFGFAGRGREALDAAERALALRPVHPTILSIRAQTLWKLGRRDEAIVAARAVGHDLTAQPRWLADSNAIYVLRQAGLQAEAEDYAARALANVPKDDYRYGTTLVALGRGKEALTYLRKLPATALANVYWHPMWDSLREDAQFQQWLVQLGCAAEYKVARETQARRLKELEAKK